MKVKHRNTDIPVSMIYPHPDNPRKELGDLSELTESIKANGIFQNLTVLWGGKGVQAAHPDESDPDGYTVIIGHRRLAAAKAAGLETVPCMVVTDMDDREQVATMLLENIQRSDLTVYEQAQGFQMMLDLGETQTSIAKKTGLSKTTVRHRLKLLELDEEEFKKSQKRQPSISDYIELEKINDPERKNKVLAKIGTSDFKWSLDSAIKEEQRAKYKAEWLAYLEEKLKGVDFKEKNLRRCISSYYILTEFSDRYKETLEIEIEENPGAVYAYDGYSYVHILGEAEEKKETKEDTEKKKAEQKRAEKCRKISELEDQAHELRRDFVAHYDTVANDEEITYAYLTDPNLDDIDYFAAAEVLRIRQEDDVYELSELLESEKWADLASFRPATLFLALLYSIYDYGSGDRTVHRWDGVYNRNERLENWYRVLKEAGYVMSSDEKRLLNGTHEVFGEGECE